MGYTTPEKRAAISALLEAGHSQVQVAALQNVSKSTVSRLAKRIRQTGQHEHASIPGRPRKLSARDDRHIAMIVSSKQADDAVQATQEFNRLADSIVSASTVRRSLARSGYVARVKKAKPLLQERHRKARLAFARKYKDWTVAEWKRVIFSDESRFKLFGSDGREWVWVSKDEQSLARRVKPTVKHGGGSIFVWGCMTSHGVGFMCKINEGLDGELYRQILEDELTATLKYYKLKAKDVVFQHDNDPKHTAKKTKLHLEKCKFQMLTWPANSPDLNPMEHLWDEVARRLKAYARWPKNAQEFWERIEEVWNGIDQATLDRLYESMPRRVADVISARGGNTNW